MCVRAKFWDRLILPQILVVFKSPTTKIDFVDFVQIQAFFWKTNYTTFSYLLMPIYEQDMSESDFLTVAAKFRSILLNFYRHLLLRVYHLNKLVIVVTKSAPDLLTPCGCPCICHEPLKCSFRIRVSECNSFLNYYTLFPGLMKILIHVMLRMDNCFLYIS